MTVLVLSVTVTWARPSERLSDLPVLVAPGAWKKPVLSPSACPTFSWTASDIAIPGELVVYRLVEEDRSEAALALSTRLPARATSWTPSGEECLEAGLYAWTVRGEQGEQWAEPLLFRVPEAPSLEDVRKALSVLRSYLESEGLGEAAKGLEIPDPGEAGGAGMRLSRQAAALDPETFQRATTPEAVEAAATGPVSGLRAEVSEATANTAAVRGVASSPTGFVYGVWGETSSPGGRGVAGWSYAASGDAFGLHGRNTSPDGAAVFGWTTAGTGPAFGVEGLTSSSAGTAVIGSAVATSGTTKGVQGISSSPNGVGGLFSNPAGGWLLAANDQPNLAGVEFYVTNDGGVFMADDLFCSRCINGVDLQFGAVDNLALSENAVTEDKIASNAVRGAEIATIVGVNVDCNGSCQTITLGQVCGEIGAGYEPLFVDCHDVQDYAGGGQGTCGTGKCLHQNVTPSTSVFNWCDDVSGSDANVYCIATN